MIIIIIIIIVIIIKKIFNYFLMSNSYNKVFRWYKSLR